MSPIDTHLRRFAPEQRAALTATCDTIRAALPGATEELSYKMPTFKVAGVPVIALDGFTRHNSLFPYSGSVLTEFADELSRYDQTKGSVHFAVDRPFPAPLLRRILKARIQEINASYPKKSGESKEFYDNGRIKARGKVKDGQLHGAWEWFRRDGTPLRAGSFRAGEQVGDWTTFDRTGQPHKITHLG